MEPYSLDRRLENPKDYVEGVDHEGGLIATGIAQAGIGAAGMGVVAEKPERTGTVLFFLVIPETLFIFGFVVALIMMLQILHP